MLNRRFRCELQGVKAGSVSWPEMAFPAIRRHDSRAVGRTETLEVGALHYVVGKTLGSFAIALA
jgi:hypothetical protein